MLSDGFSLNVCYIYPRALLHKISKQLSSLSSSSTMLSAGRSWIALLCAWHVYSVPIQDEAGEGRRGGGFWENRPQQQWPPWLVPVSMTAAGTGDLTTAAGLSTTWTPARNSEHSVRRQHGGHVPGSLEAATLRDGEGETTLHGEQTVSQGGEKSTKVLRGEDVIGELAAPKLELYTYFTVNHSSPARLWDTTSQQAPTNRWCSQAASHDDHSAAPKYPGD